MVIKIIETDAEKRILESVETYQPETGSRNMLQCRFSRLSFAAPHPDILLTDLKESLAHHHAEIFYVSDRDVLFSWTGNASETIKEIERIVNTYCKSKQCNTLPENFFRYYDYHAHGEELRTECRNKLKLHTVPPVPEQEKEAPIQKKIKAQFLMHQESSLAKTITTRKQRKAPEILIVEDQAFSRTLILNVLSKFYTCHVAKCGEEAIAVYAAYAPDIVFLDVELPDVNGHDLAQLFRMKDSRAFIIMVTGNNYAEDVERAKANKVQGFIIKPYSKQKILDGVQKYIKSKK